MFLKSITISFLRVQQFVRHGFCQLQPISNHDISQHWKISVHLSEKRQMILAVSADTFVHQANIFRPTLFIFLCRLNTMRKATKKIFLWSSGHFAQWTNLLVKLGGGEKGLC